MSFFWNQLDLPPPPPIAGRDQMSEQSLALFLGPISWMRWLRLREGSVFPKEVLPRRRGSLPTQMVTERHCLLPTSHFSPKSSTATWRQTLRPGSHRPSLCHDLLKEVLYQQKYKYAFPPPGFPLFLEFDGTYRDPRWRWCPAGCSLLTLHQLVVDQ